MTDTISIQVEPAFISACPQLPPELQFMEQALQHQVDVFEAAKNNDIILDLAPTGTGKTNAGLSVLKHNPQCNAVYIAPTNALIEQQTKAAQDFVEKASLPHIVKAASAKHIKDWTNARVGNRSGEKLYNVLREPVTLFPECKNRPILLVTNPDIFYYATFFAYNKLDRSNIASEFYSSFATVIFDEFHLYDAKQLVGLLFYIALSKVFNYFKHNRKVVLLTATPEPACETALRTLEKFDVKIARINGTESNTNLVPSQTEVSLEIRKQTEKDMLITEIVNEVINKIQKYPDQNGVVILDGKDTIGRIYIQLRDKGYGNLCGRITGDTPIQDRKVTAQKQVILATSTVDVGFNFEKDSKPTRQNLDWLIFSARDSASFWQRIGRVGRVLGKLETNIASNAVAYLPEQAWEEGLSTLESSGGRKKLQEKLENLDCMKRPFLEIYWRSEAFLEIARPLLELETSLHGLENEPLVQDLYQNLKELFKGSYSWQYYKLRFIPILVSEKLAKAPLKPTKEQNWSIIDQLFHQSPLYRKLFIQKFLEYKHTQLYSQLNKGQRTIEEIEEEIKKGKVTSQIKEFAIFWKTVYSPLFKFRDSLFENVKIRDEKGLRLDEVGETKLDPIHLLRFLEFDSNGESIILREFAEQIYQLSFSLQVDDLDKFEKTCLNKLYAFKNIHIVRTQQGTTRPTDFPVSLQNYLEENFLPGVVIKEDRNNRWKITKLKKQGLEYYPIQVEDYLNQKGNYLFFPSLSGILTMATIHHLMLPDGKDFSQTN